MLDHGSSVAHGPQRWSFHMAEKVKFGLASARRTYVR